VSPSFGRRGLVALVVGCAVAGSFTDAGAAASKGRIVATLTPPPGATTTGFDELCAVDRVRAKKFGVNGRSIVGRCGKVTKTNRAIITRVPPGRWAIAGVGGVGSLTRPGRIRVRTGQTVRVSWDVPTWG
jgi:hypothetical protein